MSNYRFSIDEHHGVPCLHVLIDTEPIAETYIPLDDITRLAMHLRAQQFVRELPITYSMTEKGKDLLKGHVREVLAELLAEEPKKGIA